MNEKIKELANKAGISYLYDYSEDGHAVVCNLNDIEKLAELIIKECAELVDDGFGSAHFGNGVAGYQLLRHFGVSK